MSFEYYYKNRPVPLKTESLEIGAVDQGTPGTAWPITATQLGEVQATPTSNTVLDRLKAILTGTILAAGSAIIGKVGIDQTTPGTTDSVSVATAQGAGAVIGTATTAAAVTTDATGTIHQYLRGLVKILNDVWDSTNHRLLVYVQGAVAAGATDSGNPVKIGGKYNASAPTLVDGQRGDAQLDVNANLKVTLASLISGESQTFNTMDVAGKFTQATAAAAATTTIKSGAGRVKRVIFPTLVASGTCKIYDNTAASGTILLDTLTIPGTITSDTPFAIDLDMAFSTGLTVVMTGTAFVADVPYI
jgi:hypothetical protein